MLIITVKNTFHPNMDTIANLLAKRFGRGKHLPLESYLLRVPYSFMMRNRFSVMPIMSRMASCTSEVNMNRSMNESYVRGTNNNSSICRVRGISDSPMGHRSTLSRVSLHSNQKTACSSNTGIGNLQPCDNNNNEIHNHNINNTPRTIGDQRNADRCNYNQNQRRYNRNYQTCSGNLFFNRRLLVRPGSAVNFDDDDDDCSDGDFGMTRTPALWPAIDPNNRIIAGSIQSSVNNRLSGKIFSD
ncbi:unnamed protein product [Trichobilharzia regenti]|nr:unnamed protein product [Trichobilharzia regenti]